MLRDRAPLWMGIMLLVVALSLAVSLGGFSPTTDHRAAALLLAGDLGVHTDNLPKTAASTFEVPSLAEEVVATSGLAIPPSELIPRHAEVEPVEDTVLIRVVGRHPEPEVARDIANAAGAALASRLSAIGPSIGPVALVQPARTPLEPPRDVSLASAGLVGGLTGLTLVLALASTLAAARRPAIDAIEAAEWTERPLAGAVRVPQSSGPDLGRSVGLEPVVEAVRGSLPGPIELVATSPSLELEARLACLLGRRLAEEGDVSLTVPSALLDVAHAWTGSSSRLTVSPHLHGASPPHRATLTLVSAGTPRPAGLPPPTLTMLVVGEGTAQRRLEWADLRHEMGPVVFVGWLRGLLPHIRFSGSA